MVDEAGQPANLRDRANGAVIEVVVDHSDGSLAFGVNGALHRVDDFAFPSHAPLRPWAELRRKSDRVSFCGVLSL